MRYLLMILIVSVIYGRIAKAQDDNFILNFPDNYWKPFTESEPEVIHLDIPWLCKYCNTEIIYDKPNSEDEDESYEETKPF